MGEAAPLQGEAPGLPLALQGLFEELSRNVHERWAQGRLGEGWIWGPERNDVRKEHPCLVPYEELPESEREFDRQTVRATLESILALGFRIQPAEAEDTVALTVKLEASGGGRSAAPDASVSGTPGPRLRAGALLGKYELIRPLGSGGFGEVWQARDTGITQRDVALKSIRLQCDAGQRDSLLAEARIMARIFHHPNFPVLYDVLESEGNFVLVVEYLPGYDLDWLIAHSEGPIGWLDVRNCMKGLLAGLQHAHRYGVLHGDIKPRNIRVFNPLPQPRPLRVRDVKILDFGLGVLWKEQAALDPEGWPPVSALPIMGTPEYMSPEQVRGGPLTPASDLYAVGLILYELITRQRPFLIAPGQSRSAYLEAHCCQPPRNPRALRPDLPEELVAILSRCLAKTPAERFPDALALESELLPILDQLCEAWLREEPEQRP